MHIYTQLIALLFLFTSCNTPASDAEKTVTDFYSWYLENYYNNENNIDLEFVIINGIQTLDTGNYFGVIRESGFFSEKYIESRKAQIEPCLKSINKIDTNKVQSFDGNPAELIKGTDCSFLFYYNFLFHQGEETIGVNVYKSEINNSSAQIYLNQLGGNNKPNGFKAKVLLEKEGKWRITSIEPIEN